MLQNNYFFAERRCDVRLFPTVSPTPLDLQKKNCVARKCLFLKEMRVGQVLAWSCCRPFPTVSDRFRPFPTVSDRFRPFHFFWRINWTKSIYGRLIQCKPVQTMTLKFFHVFSCDPCARTLHQILHLDLDIQYSLKITKSQELVKFNTQMNSVPEGEISL